MFPGVGEVWAGCGEWMEPALECGGRDLALPGNTCLTCSWATSLKFVSVFLSWWKTDGDGSVPALLAPLCPLSWRNPPPRCKVPSVGPSVLARGSGSEELCLASPSLLKQQRGASTLPGASLALALQLPAASCPSSCSGQFSRALHGSPVEPVYIVLGPGLGPSVLCVHVESEPLTSLVVVMPGR